MSKIIIKKGLSTIKENNGYVLPIFKIDNNEYLRIESNDFPSTGTIFVSAGFNEFEKDTFYEFDYEKLKINDHYERDLAAYKNGEKPNSPSKYILSYYHSNHSYPKVFIKLQVRFAIAYKQVNITKLC